VSAAKPATPADIWSLLMTFSLRQGKTVLMEDIMLKHWQELKVRMRLPPVPLSSLLLRVCLRQH
jgi:hypothetical protein